MLNAMFKSIIEQDRNPVVICDLQHIIVYMNLEVIVFDLQHEQILQLRVLNDKPVKRLLNIIQ